MVAHRLSTVRHCDRVAFLKEGRVEAYGTFDEVREQSAEFNHLVELGRLEGEAPVPASFQEVIDEVEGDRDAVATRAEPLLVVGEAGAGSARR